MLFSCFCPLSLSSAINTHRFSLWSPVVSAAEVHQHSPPSHSQLELGIFNSRPFNLCSHLSQSVSFIFNDQLLTCPSAIFLQMLPPHPSVYFSFLCSYLGGSCPDLPINLFCTICSSQVWMCTLVFYCFFHLFFPLSERLPFCLIPFREI